MILCDRAADQLGVHCKFHKVKQKPGKPLYFGTKENTIIFGLPGNPASVVSCFYEYVLPAVRFMLHLPQEEPVSAILKNDFKKVKGLTQFLKAFDRRWRSGNSGGTGILPAALFFQRELPGGPG